MNLLAFNYMDFPKITVITPSFNSGKFIEQTMDSVLSQAYPNLEYIVIDGGSNDGTVDIIKKYGKHLAYWVSESDKGQSQAINKGLKRASGDIINWLNSDDYYEPGTLSQVAKAFQDPAVSVLCGRSRLFKDSGETVRYSQGTDVYTGNLAKTIGWARIDQPETFFRKSAVEKMGPLNPAFHFVMDKEWWVKYLLLFGLSGVKKIDEVLVNYRLHEESKTVSQSEKFEEETSEFFFSLAKHYKLNLLAAVIQETEHFQDSELQLKDYSSNYRQLVYQAINYYLLYKADFFYYYQKKKQSEIYLNCIDKEVLAAEDRKLLSRLKIKNKFVPRALAKWIRG